MEARRFWNDYSTKSQHCHSEFEDEGLGAMNLKIEVEREADGRWIAEVLELSGCLAYGKTKADMLAKAKALALRVLADSLEHGEPMPAGDDCFPSHEPVGLLQIAMRPCRVAPHRLDNQTAARHLTSDSRAGRLAGFCFRISRRRRDWAKNVVAHFQAHRT
jgi:predicted RNase H-like HicB family nuclease